jgi:hypothetical protein
MSKRDYRRENLKKRYNISLEEYDGMLVEQGFVCAICGKECRKNMYLSVDHDHETGLVRGLLCDDCNNGLAKFFDDVTLLQKAIEYLNERRQ